MPHEAAPAREKGGHALLVGQTQFRVNSPGRDHRRTGPAAPDPYRLHDHLRRYNGGPVVATARAVLHGTDSGFRARSQRTLCHGTSRWPSAGRALRPLRAPGAGAARPSRGVALAQRLGRHRTRACHPGPALRYGDRLRAPQGLLPTLRDGDPGRLVGVYSSISGAGGDLRPDGPRPHSCAGTGGAPALGGALRGGGDLDLGMGEPPPQAVPPYLSVAVAGPRATWDVPPGP